MTHKEEYKLRIKEHRPRQAWLTPESAAVYLSNPAQAEYADKKGHKGAVPVKVWHD